MVGRKVNIKMWLLKNELKTLDAAVGNNKSMFSLIMPYSDPISRVINKLNTEYGSARDIQNNEDRSRYFWAINSAKKMLKELDTVHYAGLAVYIGTVLNEEGHEVTYTRKFEPNFEPFGPMTASLYQFDSRFHIAALQRLLDEDDCYGVIVMDRKGIMFTTIRDNRHEFHDTYTFLIELMWSHQVRVDMAYLSYYDKVEELATKYFTSNSHPNMKGLILCGDARFLVHKWYM